MLKFSFDLLGVDPGPSWIEIAKLASDLSIPIIIAIVGFFIQRRMHALGVKSDANRDLVAARLARIDEMAGLLNDVFCYCTYVGHWREMTPLEVLHKKRDLDAIVFGSLPIWSGNFAKAYKTFISSCFSVYLGEAVEAKILGNILRYKREFRGQWDTAWDTMFLDPYQDRADVRAHSHRQNVIQPAYSNLLAMIGRDLGSEIESAQITELWTKEN